MCFLPTLMLYLIKYQRRLRTRTKIPVCKLLCEHKIPTHYIDVIMTTVAFQITSLAVVYSIVIQAQIKENIKENIKAPRHWPLCAEFTGTGEFPAQRASNAENGSTWWRHHGHRRVVSQESLPLDHITPHHWIRYGKTPRGTLPFYYLPV